MRLDFSSSSSLALLLVISFLTFGAQTVESAPVSKNPPTKAKVTDKKTAKSVKGKTKPLSQSKVCEYDQRTKMIQNRIKKNLERKKSFIEYGKKSRQIRGSGFSLNTEKPKTNSEIKPKTKSKAKSTVKSETDKTKKKSK